MNATAFRKFLLTLTIICCCVDSSASVSSSDYQTPGDNLIVVDNRMGVEWLALSVTANWSYNDVVAPDSIFSRQGFRLATDTDMGEFLFSADVWPNVPVWGNRSMGFSFGPGAYLYPRTSNLLSLFGCLTCAFEGSGLSPMSIGYIDSTTSGHIQGMGFGTWELFDGTQYGSLNYMSQIAGSRSPAMGFDESHPLVGAFLIRQISSVPEPTTYAMLIVGLGILFALPRR